MHRRPHADHAPTWQSEEALGAAKWAPQRPRRLPRKPSRRPNGLPNAPRGRRDSPRDPQSPKMVPRTPLRPPQEPSRAPNMVSRTPSGLDFGAGWWVADPPRNSTASISALSGPHFGPPFCVTSTTLGPYPEGLCDTVFDRSSCASTGGPKRLHQSVPTIDITFGTRHWMFM